MQISFLYTALMLSAYLGILVVLGYLSSRHRKDPTYSDFYLAGRGMGTFILGFTLFATQYSGNTLLAIPANTYRTGFDFFVSITFGIAIIGAYLLYAPRLHKLSKQHEFVTPCDFVNFKWQSQTLSRLINIIFIVILAGYIITNLKIMGLVVANLTDGKISFTQAIIGLTVVLMIYETIGGMRAVAWTDAIQGMILLTGCMLIFFIIQREYGSIFSHLHNIQINRPEFFNPPTTQRFFQWASTLFLVAFGASIYPHAIQRIYAAKSERSLKRSFRIMLFIPFFTTLPMIIVGIMGVSLIPGLDRSSSESIILLVINDLIQRVPALSWVALLFFTAVIASIMSTVDSVILTLTSIFTKDMSQIPIKTNKPGKSIYMSWVIMIPCILLALYLPQTLWRLMEFKLELLIQVAPVFFIGLYTHKTRALPFITGILTGTFIVLLMTASGIKVPGLQTGIVALTGNLLTLWLILLNDKYKGTLRQAIAE